VAHGFDELAGYNLEALVSKDGDSTVVGPRGIVERRLILG
jgi:hypothetical protein